MNVADSTEAVWHKAWRMLRKFSKIDHLLLVLNIRVQKTIHDLPLFGKLQLSNMEWLSFQITWILLPYKNLTFCECNWPQNLTWQFHLSIQKGKKDDGLLKRTLGPKAGSKCSGSLSFHRWKQAVFAVLWSQPHALLTTLGARTPRPDEY
jgi:hypothetical protein